MTYRLAVVSDIHGDDPGAVLRDPAPGAENPPATGPRSRGKLPLLPVVVRSGGGCSAGRFAVHAFDLVSGDSTRRCIAAR